MIIWQNNFLIIPLLRDHYSAFQNLHGRTCLQQDLDIFIGAMLL
jgi:hypothetical protein